MFEQLIKAVRNKVKKSVSKQRQVKEGTYPAIATLREWHLFDTDSQRFRWLDPEKDESVEKIWVDDMIYGYGFSYFFTRAAWEEQAFPDIETCEDDIFMQLLRKKDVLVELVTSPSPQSGLCAHSLHPGSTSGGEWNGQKRCGTLVSPPREFEHLIPVVREVIKCFPDQMGSSKFMSKQVPVGAVPKAFGFRHSATESKGKGKGPNAPKMFPMQTGGLGTAPKPNIPYLPTKGRGRTFPISKKVLGPTFQTVRSSA
mmetsp:Transcript_889/g.2191  ORF Transcript_889/g.2191 Transcript_889/m.2191 type:complete len:256 (+) Transcript_889:97-864(+)